MQEDVVAVTDDQQTEPMVTNPRRQKLETLLNLEGLVNEALSHEPGKITASEARAQHQAYYY
jgi:hypothetical protein